MARGNNSGYRLDGGDIPVVLGMSARGDREHDIAAWFGVNQGRVADAKKGKWGMPKAAAANALPPKGAPGIKGRRLRGAVGVATAALSKKGEAGMAEAIAALKAALGAYDKHEI